jgi:hypothetical protein
MAERSRGSPSSIGGVWGATRPPIVRPPWAVPAAKKGRAPPRFSPILPGVSHRRQGDPPRDEPAPSPALPSGTRRAQRTARSVRGASILAASAAILVATPAQAEGDTFADTLILDSGRPELAPADAEKVELQVHGEYALRFRGMSDLRLEPPVSNPALTTLGQNAYAYHWFRLTPRFRYRDKLQLVAQIDIPRGLVLGDVTEGVGAVRDSMSEARWYEVHPRYLYLEYNSPIGIFRVGQQGAFWGMGIPRQRRRSPDDLR